MEKLRSWQCVKINLSHTKVAGNFQNYEVPVIIIIVRHFWLR